MRAAPVIRLAWFATGIALLACAGGARAEVKVTAEVGQRQLTVGEATPLVVAVRGAGRVDAPAFKLPDGLQLLGSSRSESHSWVNGKINHEIQFRFEIGALDAGHFTVGPIDVRADGKVYRSPSITLDVAAAARRVGGSTGSGPASLIVDVTPRTPYVGQPVTMRVRLIQRASLAEDPQYTPPPTPGFWAEAQRQPESYYADEGLARVLVTETRSRLYPLAAGRATIGEATVVVALAMRGGAIDPMMWLRGQVPRREMALQSKPVNVNVRPLPGGAPAGFDGAVGSYLLSWDADRPRTPRDVPFTVRLSVRGVGNVPLLRAPVFASDDVEVLGQTLDDSLASPGSEDIGRRAFVWTLLPKRQGRNTLSAPTFAWFDPKDERYHVGPPLALAIDVGPALGATDDASSGFPVVFASDAADPGARRASPWAWALAGLALGTAWRVWRSAGGRPRQAPEDGERRKLLCGVRAATGDNFWSAAEQACTWLERHDRPQRQARRAVESARYGGARTGEADVRRVLEGALVHAAPETPRRTMRRLIAAGIALVGVALAFGFGPWPGGGSSAARVRQADRLARAGRLEEASSAWRAAWNAGARHPALAARLAWVQLESGQVPSATMWVLRGDRVEPRDPSLHWVVERVRETGGLVGFAPVLPPLRHLEWALAALAAGTLAAAGWRRRRVAWPALLLAVACTVTLPVTALHELTWRRAIVRVPTTLDGAGIELEPGQVVTVLAHDGARARVSAGREAVGWIPVTAAVPLERAR